MAPSPSFYNGEEPALQPAKSFEQRPTAPSPRQPARKGISDNIYAGAGTATRGVGTASSSQGYSSGRGRVDNVRSDNTRASAGELTPSPSAVNEPSVPLPTPAQAFERRLAENPIVPAGAFGGSRPTAHFFSQSKPSPPAESSSSSSSSSREVSMDEAEKKRIASEAYKTFEKQITDSRNTPNSKGGVPPSRSNPPNLLSSLSQGNPVESRGQPVDQREIERKKHQDMVKAADMSPDKAKFGAPATAAVDAKKPENESKPRQTLNDIQKSAAAASAKRMSLADRAAQAELDRKAEERRINAEQRRAREAAIRGEPAIRAEETRINAKNEATKRPESSSSGNQLQANAKGKVATEKDSLERKSNVIDQKDEVEQAPKQIESKGESSIKGKIPVSDRLEKEAKGFGKNQVDKKASPVGETSKASPKENAAKGETSEKPGKQTTTMESTTKGEVKKQAPSKNGLKAPKYDVIVKSQSEMDMQPLDMPQLLQGSLTDLLKNSGPKRGSGNNRPRGRSDY